MRTRCDKGIVEGKKRCSGCLANKALDCFNKQATAKTGLRSKCKECRKKENSKPEAIERNRIKSALWRNKNKDRLSSYNREYRKKPEAKERIKQRVKISADARYRVLTDKAYYSSMELMFEDGMSFSNHGEWHIDHIVPITAWLDKGITDLDIINDISNLQPLWAKDNLLKSNKHA